MSSDAPVISRTPSCRWWFPGKKFKLKHQVGRKISRKRSRQAMAGPTPGCGMCRFCREILLGHLTQTCKQSVNSLGYNISCVELGELPAPSAPPQPQAHCCKVFPPCHSGPHGRHKSQNRVCNSSRFPELRTLDLLWKVSRKTLKKKISAFDLFCLHFGWLILPTQDFWKTGKDRLKSKERYNFLWNNGKYEGKQSSSDFLKDREWDIFWLLDP